MQSPRKINRHSTALDHGEAALAGIRGRELEINERREKRRDRSARKSAFSAASVAPFFSSHLCPPREKPISPASREESVDPEVAFFGGAPCTDYCGIRDALSTVSRVNTRIRTPCEARSRYKRVNYTARRVIQSTWHSTGPFYQRHTSCIQKEEGGKGDRERKRENAASTRARCTRNCATRVPCAYARKRQLRAYGAALSTTRHSHQRRRAREPRGRRGSPQGRGTHGHLCVRECSCAHKRVDGCTHALCAAHRATCGARTRGGSCGTKRTGSRRSRVDPLRNRNRAFLKPEIGRIVVPLSTYCRHMRACVHL